MLDMPGTIMAKNYSHCPLKKRPVQMLEDIPDEPENLSTKPEDLSRTGRLASVSPSSLSPVSPNSSVKTSPPPSPPMRSPSPHYYPPKTEILPYQEYAPQTWHRSVAPLYPPVYHPFVDYMGMSPTYSESSLSPPHHHVQQPLQPLALRPYQLDQASLSPSSWTTSPPPNTTPEDLSEKRRQGVRHQCPDCGKSYSTFSGLSKHRQFHCAAGEGPKKSFSCKFCEKVYVSLGALKMHIRTHTLPCKCTICGKAFSRPWLLQGHIRTHTGEKPFSCTYCNRAFADRSNLRAHLQTHSDVKKYSCPTCSKTFSRMSLLTKHAEGGCSGVHQEKMY
ncbi:escargot/snail protein homolog [Tribolium castaneum]|uniref:Escargot n=1 Tax=Tribolium castaneum TaxID=7070 RepID=D6WM50_TRICA|nr:PREDICTED: escargot/snail protein homolog [Tribolium castaneum]EFA04685.1 escargot [Tribolium castaneum]|eukprot:XP_966462.1 PREDICTED: escargot/snail protein homolog [Tribolium castaneum]